MSTPSSLPQKLSQDTFRRALHPVGKDYLPKKFVDKLKAAGLHHYLYKPHVTKQEAMRVLKFLKGEGMSPRPHPPSELYRAAAKAQFEHDEEIRQAEMSQRVQRDIRYDIEKEMEQQDAMRTGVLAEHQEKLTQKHRVGEIYRVEREEQRRGREREKLKKKRDERLGPKGIDPKRPPLVEPPDMPIG